MKNPNPVEKATPNDAALDPKVLETIGRALKAHYDDLVHAPLPEKLLDLLAQLDREEQLEKTEKTEKPEEKPDASG
ncbi:MAG TPA: NepR family anti-sigma factor [Roseiarcus sp.]|nr:NepR family anti-sigma factor [Roseiarcus sp.]